MRKLLAPLAFLLLVAPAGASAVEIGLRGQSSYPMVYAGYSEMSGGAELLLRFGGDDVAAGIALGVGRESYESEGGANESAIVGPVLLGDLQWRLGGGPLRPYLGGAAGVGYVSHRSSAGDQDVTGASAGFLVQPVAGLRLALGPFAVEADAGPRWFLAAGAIGVGARLGFVASL